MKRKAKYIDPQAGFERRMYLKARHTTKAKRAAASSISQQRFEKTRRDRQQTKKSQKRNRRK